MAKIALLVLVVLAVVAVVQGRPTSYEDIVAAAKSGNWDQLHQLINSNLADNPAWKPVDFNNIRSLKPVQGGQVYGEAEYTFQSSSNVNGHQTSESGGHKVINDNGKVDEFDFKPSHNM